MSLWSLSASAADWPQLGNGPQHTGYSAEKLKPPFKLKWNVQFQPERLYPAMQPVIAGGHIFLGTEGGNLHCLNAADGKRLWKFPAAADERVGPILHSAGVEGGKVFFASMDGCVYAVEAGAPGAGDGSGKLAWKFESKFRTGFSTAVLLAEGKVFAPNRGGTLFALNQSDGSVAWKADFACPLLQSPAFNGGCIYVAGMDCRLYALDAKDGKELWKTEPLKGALAFKDYWPVVHKGLVIVRPFGPWEATAFDEKTGQPVTLAIPGGITMNGAVAPPCVDGEGRLVTARDSGWCRVDAASKEIEYISEKGGPGKRAGGVGNTDENMIAGAAGGLIFVMHCQEGNAQFTGCYEIPTKKWTPIGGGPWQNLVSNTQGGGASQPVVADGHLFHASLHGLRCFSGGQ
ncbi:MAG TPA: PQQ-binding-like beta-propeller repeat protein [Planctomycetota bacterium]|nr:PQQ-binding-like beta-propeller repeat protein [Planctomycetota bacterium]